MPRLGRLLVVALLGTGAVLVAGEGARSGTAAALELYRAARYREAAQALAEPDGADAEAAPVLRACLETSPSAALALLEAATAAGSRDGTARLESAAIRFGQGRYREAARLLEAVTTASPEPPGRALLLAGLALRAAGDTDGAERMLATVKPEDPAFPAARTALGDLALADRDPVKALRYYDSAGDDARAGAGRWQALRQTGREDDAERLRRRLEDTAAGSVAILEINRLQRLEADEREARQAQQATPAEAGSTETAAAQGRYTLQLGAYSDRGLALELVRRFGDEVPDLRVDTVRDAHGQLLYKVRSGFYVNPAAARSEAERLKRRLGVDVFVAETAD